MTSPVLVMKAEAKSYGLTLEVIHGKMMDNQQCFAWFSRETRLKVSTAWPMDFWLDYMKDKPFSVITQ